MACTISVHLDPEMVLFSNLSYIIVMTDEDLIDDDDMKGSGGGGMSMMDVTEYL